MTDKRFLEFFLAGSSQRIWYDRLSIVAMQQCGEQTSSILVPEQTTAGGLEWKRVEGNVREIRLQIELGHWPTMEDLERDCASEEER